MSNFIFQYSIIFIISILLGCVLLMAYIWGKRRRLSAKEIVFFQKKWQMIGSIFENDPRHGLLEADKLLDILLERKGYRGPLGEKLKKAQRIFSDIDGIWKAHKERNKIAHELGYGVSSVKAKECLIAYKRAYVDLGIKV